MPIRGVRNPFPKVKPLTNSGIFSKSGAGQKKDATPGTDAGTQRGRNEAMKNTTLKSSGGNTGKSAGEMQRYAHGHNPKGGGGGASARSIQDYAHGSNRKGGGGGASVGAVQDYARRVNQKRGF
jgi:hypothetical protein